MGFWDEVSNGLDNLGKSIEAFGNDTVRATKEFSQIQKLKSEAADAKRAVNTQYLKLGRKYYEDHKDEPEAADDPMLRTISENLKKIEDCEEEIARLKAASDEAKAYAADEADAEEAAQDIAAEEREAARQEERRNAQEVDDDVVDCQPVADDSDFEPEE